MSVRKKKTAKAYSLAQPISEGTLLTDLQKRYWSLGPAIGQGGFGRIYSVKKWLAERHGSSLGIPRYISSGLVQPSNQGPCRFLIMDRFTGDFESVLMRGNVHPNVVIKLSCRVLEALEYLHSKDHAHADIKASNLLYLDKVEKVTLVDFGLVHLFRVGGVHKPAKIDPKFKHCGTAEFCSRDAHQGLAPSRRGDVEILVYNLIHWLSRCQPGAIQSHSFGLPWSPLVSDVTLRKNLPVRVLEQVGQQKEQSIQNPTQLIQFTGLSSSSDLIQLVKLARDLKYDEEPNYTAMYRCLTALQSQTRELSISVTKARPIRRSMKRQSLDKQDAYVSLDANQSTPSASKTENLPKKLPKRGPSRNASRGRGTIGRSSKTKPDRATNSNLSTLLTTDTVPPISSITPSSAPSSVRKNTPQSRKVTHPRTDNTLLKPPVQSPLPLMATHFLNQPSNVTPTRSSPRLQALQSTLKPFDNPRNREKSILFSDSEDEFDQLINRSIPRSVTLGKPSGSSSRGISQYEMPKSTSRKALSQLNPSPVRHGYEPEAVARSNRRCSGWCQTSPELLMLAKAEALGHRAAELANQHWSQKRL